MTDLAARARRAMQKHNRTQTQEKAAARGPGREIPTISLGSTDYIVPFGWPTDKTVKLSSAWYLKEGDSCEGILMDQVIDTMVHSFDSFPNYRALGENLSPEQIKRRAMDRHFCAYKSIENCIQEIIEAGDTGADGMVWEETEEGDLVHMDGNYQVTLYKAGRKGTQVEWALSFPYNRDDVSDESLGSFENLDDAKAMAYAVIKSQKSCPLCFYNSWWWKTQKDVSEEPRPEVGSAYPTVMLPFVNMSWLPGGEEMDRGNRSPVKRDGRKADAKKPALRQVFSYQLNGMSAPVGHDWYPEEGDVAIRRGLAYIATSALASSRSQRQRTLENFEAYRAKLATLDANLIAKATIRKQRELFKPEYEISIQALVCPATGEPIVDIGSLPDENHTVLASEEFHVSPGLTEQYLELTSDEERAEFFDSLVAGDIFAMPSEANDAVLVLPQIVAATRDGNSEFRRLQVSEVLTRIKRVEGGFFTFEVVLHEDGKVIRDWTKEPGTFPPEKSVSEIFGETYGALLAVPPQERTALAEKLLNPKEHFDLEHFSPEKYHELLNF